MNSRYQRIEAASASLRTAVESGEYARAGRELTNYVQAVEEMFSGLASDDRKKVPTQYLDVLTWARKALLLQRTHLASQLLALDKTRSYITPITRPSRVDVEL